MDGEFDNELPLLLFGNVVAAVTVTVHSDAFVIVTGGDFDDGDVDSTTHLDFWFVLLTFDGSVFIVVGNDIHCCPGGSEFRFRIICDTHKVNTI